MKKLTSLLMALLMATVLMADDREHTLKIYNWADYIDMTNVLDKFPEWYKDQTGEEAKIIYQTFDINESMLTEIEIGKEDYDVVCPSEYIIERMLRNNLLLKIDKNYGELTDYTKLVSPFAQRMFQQMAPEGSGINVADYAVGYMGGTTGIIYNPAYVNADDIRSLGGLLDPKFTGKVFMKDAFRDIYSVVVLYVYKDEIARGEVTREELVAHVNEERIARVEKFLTDMKNNIAGWEVDFGKEEMTKGKTWMNLSWSGDAQWAIDEAAEVGVKLEYLVPEEGSNVWFDGWVIPKYAKNTKAASYFINYMCMPENAILNMEEIGYMSVIASPEILEWADDEEANEETADLSYFFGDGAEAVHANQVLYADRSVIERCALMHDCGDQTEAMLAMWNRVKGDNLSSTMVIIIVLIGLVVILFAVVQTMNRRREKALHTKKHNKR
ncbi:MAG: ABC transporter substrate-binding protein [Paludibacteraceae bacterium]|nr:ABC transporter substrate-binding protein [Paludibacteraceae bacterium]